jgi:metal-responsive CopG/Arc/MetJ family transcriptional regulator
MNKEICDKVAFSMTFEGELAKKFDVIKRYYGLENNTEVIRILLYEKYKQLFPKEA